MLAATVDAKRMIPCFVSTHVLVKLMASSGLPQIRTLIWVFPKIRGTILGVPIIRIIVYWGLYWGSLISGNDHIQGPQRGAHHLHKLPFDAT